jgi:NAD(P)-dependent dehydrogenase (short-subunit alcohol dehydrogenase family)
MVRAMNWTVERVPDQAGKTIVVTGANSGIGLAATRILASRGARVVLACRDTAKGEKARAQIAAVHPDAQISVQRLDLADLGSVREFAAAVSKEHQRLDVLVNNAGVMALPYCKTCDGFEMQFGTNHLGHFALTGLLLPRLMEAPSPRVVTVASVAHYFGSIDFEDLHGEKSYWRWPAYAQSKLANLLFVKELARRVERAGMSILSVACHPGYASTNLTTAGARMDGSSFKQAFMKMGNALAQSAEYGSMPTVYAATADDVKPGDYIGPDGLLELVGLPRKVGVSSGAEDPKVAARLWQVSEELTGVRFDVLGSPSEGAAASP